MRNFVKRVFMKAWGKELVPIIDIRSGAMHLVVGALLGAIAVILQSAGIFTGIGYLFSTMTTLPLALAGLLSLRIGVMTYSLTGLLLAILQPSELLIFLFTTGLLGLSLGTGIRYLKRSILVSVFPATCLTSGISILLYGFRFAVLGPSITSHFSSLIILGVFGFALLYGWIWKKISISAFNKVVSK